MIFFKLMSRLQHTYGVHYTFSTQVHAQKEGTGTACVVSNSFACVRDRLCLLSHACRDSKYGSCCSWSWHERSGGAGAYVIAVSCLIDVVVKTFLCEWIESTERASITLPLGYVTHRLTMARYRQWHDCVTTVHLFFNRHRLINSYWILAY